MATLLRKIGLIRLNDRDTEDPKHHHHRNQQGSVKSSKGKNCSNKQQGGSAGGGGSSGGGSGGCCSNNSTTTTEGMLGQADIKGKKTEQCHKDKHGTAAGKEKNSAKETSTPTITKEAKQPGGGSGGGGNKQSGGSSLQPLVVPPNRQHCTQVRSRRLMKELQDIRKLSDHFISVELVDDNLFDWNVKLHQVDKDSTLWQDMKETNTEYILLNLTFPDNFPFSPPFMRVLTPRLENGYVLDGGAICMELLTPRGWSSAYTVEAVMRQFAASLVKGQGRICRKAGKSKKAFSRKEAEATFKSLVKTHEKYGWVTPPVSDG
ncbi:PREDICTED: ubiquitin-conjugating enzyme E2Q-like protein 1 [Nanorana parkeri]|uniref:ubiquitin-conjugating enzyme E2Q-like protein 1 n=1 Tax=Nanorana parkeri TaxID=125878 RepID=UPI00085491B2|nr:PREDICTED: ubiquitin-conjugating enzyme E2Q-like protein 1 [Nanorana parkeri]